MKNDLILGTLAFLMIIVAAVFSIIFSVAPILIVAVAIKWLFF